MTSLPHEKHIAASVLGCRKPCCSLCPGMHCYMIFVRNYVGQLLNTHSECYIKIVSVVLAG